MNTVSAAANRAHLWAKELFADVIDGLYFNESGLMGEGDNNIIQVKSDLMKQAGDTIVLPLSAKLTGNGVDGDNELEGHEESISSYSESILIDQKRFGVRLQGKLDERKVAYDMRKDAKEKLTIRLQEFLERQIFLKLGGVTNTTVTDVGGTVVATGAAWSNTPTPIPIADEAAGTGSRYICACATGTDALAATDLITPGLISRAKIKAMLAHPKIQPLRIDGRDHYVLWVHPWQAYDLKNNAQFAQAMREAEVRGKDNPIFTGSLGVWDGVIVYEHPYVPFLDVSVALNSFEAAAGGTTDAAVDMFRALLCGRQAAVFAKCQSDNGWVEETFDYKNKVGFATSLIGGIDKVMFNSLEYGVIAIDTAATSLA
jgi:N4-gp56 family major capsid protein